ncbi:response regulator [Gottfriedia acidiceleris]|uniref:Response regulator transcription factor n=1 Tax=Gottfriedia acidiceleris TaxID=371036 RepID=A0ABY4JJP5_9BACI|nr:response regulator transcription factor [Gottfriedia acidiceleris]UPM54072.1 response regulator transcription factor [Gottfriedia acidiceleris]
MSIKILIADDHHVVRRGLIFFLNTQDDIEVIGEASNGEEALSLVKQLRPDIVIMDLAMPVLDGIEATKRIKIEGLAVKVMILTSFYDQDHILPAIEAGAAGYYLKDSDPDELVSAIRKIHDGEKQFHSKVTTQLVSALTGKIETKNDDSFQDKLTKREMDVLKEITRGKSNKEIAASLFITEKTVKTHVSNILAKTQLQDRTQLALYAVRNGILK